MPLDPYTINTPSERAAAIRGQQATALRRLADMLDAGTLPPLNSGLSVWLDDADVSIAAGMTRAALVTQVMGALDVDLAQTPYRSAGDQYRDHAVFAYDSRLSAQLPVTVWVRDDRTPAEPESEPEPADDATCPGGC